MSLETYQWTGTHVVKELVRTFLLFATGKVDREYFFFLAHLFVYFLYQSK